MDKPRVVIEVRGGVVVTVSCDVGTEVIVVDYDDIALGEGMPAGYLMSSTFTGQDAIRAAHARAEAAVQACKALDALKT